MQPPGGWGRWMIIADKIRYQLSSGAAMESNRRGQSKAMELWPSLAAFQFGTYKT
jgi:hypothetical protein